MSQEPAIIRRRLGKTDIELPIVSFGVMRSDNAALVKSAFEMGFVHFDTAHGYQEGKNETMLGNYLKIIHVSLLCWPPRYRLMMSVARPVN